MLKYEIWSKHNESLSYKIMHQAWKGHGWFLNISYTYLVNTSYVGDIKKSTVNHPRFQNKNLV